MHSQQHEQQVTTNNTYIHIACMRRAIVNVWAYTIFFSVRAYSFSIARPYNTSLYKLVLRG